MPTNMQSLFDHLVRKEAPKPNTLDSIGYIHPATLKLGDYFSNGIIHEDDDRVVALICAFRDIIRDYSTPAKKSISMDLDKYISAQVQHLIHCRLHSITMGNVIKFTRFNISQLPPDLPEAQAKQKLIGALTTYLEERIVFARKSISLLCIESIRPNDVILTFGSSALIRQILVAAAAVKQFRVIVVDTRPLNEGRKTLECLTELGISCVYTLLTGASFVIRDATMVLLGASAILSNGTVLAEAGTAMVASLAKANRIPVMFAAESVKFSYKVQLDAIVYNELGHASEVLEGVGVEEREESNVSLPPHAAMGQEVSLFHGSYRGQADTVPPKTSTGTTPPFSVVNLRYDLTPIANVSVIATESGLIPATSIPVLIKEMKMHGGSTTAAPASTPTTTAPSSTTAVPTTSVSNNRSRSTSINR